VVKISVPIHVTGFWIIRRDSDVIRTGSVGVGIVLNPRIEISVKMCRGITNQIYINDRLVRLKIIDDVIKEFSPNERVIIKVNSKVDLGVGYGASGALCLGTAVGLALIKGMSILKASHIAHKVEVENMTGLGDVVAEYYGGKLVVREKPGPPGIGRVRKIDVPDDIKILTVPLGYEETCKILKYENEINRYGELAFTKFIRDPNFVNFLKLAYEFSKKLNFIPSDVEQIMSRLKDLVLGYYVKKKVLVIACRVENLKRVSNYLNSNGYEVLIHELESSGIRFRRYGL